VINDDMMLFQHEYLEERTDRPGRAGWYVLRIDDGDKSASIAKGIDDQFRNSNAATKTGTEQAFNASFATMWGNVSLLMGTIGMAVVFAILLVTANAMMMSARERTREVAVLKTIGFTDRTLFGMVMLEAGLIAGIGALLGLGGAKLLYKSTNFNAGGFLPGFDVTGQTLAIGAGVTLLLMLASGLVPAVRAARLPVVQALRRVE
jgi:putative ABC transport system permease protein